MPSLPKIKSIFELPGLIESRYQKSDLKVTEQFFIELYHAAENVLRKFPPSYRQVMLLSLRKLYARVQVGITAAELHREVSRIIRQRETDEPLRIPDSSISRLERQLKELRMSVTSAADIERKFRDLQEQVEAIQEDMEGGRSTLAEKQEDMLQKFLVAPKKAFIIMPFQRDFDNVWLGAIKPACAESHYAPLRVDEVNLSSLITEDIERYSNMADVVVVDLTGNNPNVMFELGWSLAKNKKPIVLCQGEHTSKVAFDVRGIRHISYENSWLGIEDLKKKLKNFISTTEKQSPIKPKKKTKARLPAKGESASKS
ncbi:MAG: nucleoside 2-deoxyribosyltransferase [candidate division Zixibacteria bacterium]|nr:nucleoside 2-deoxyribosyltransferase [candidate division Zixibacteria bacterium]